MINTFLVTPSQRMWESKSPVFDVAIQPVRKSMQIKMANHQTRGQIASEKAKPHTAPTIDPSAVIDLSRPRLEK